MFPTKILLATDGSKDACFATWSVVDVCEGTGADLHFVHVWHSASTARLRAFMRAELKRLGQELLEEGVAEARRAGANVAGVHLVEGRAPDG
jgi:nucleotide-binding universal stress UspA family protein